MRELGRSHQAIEGYVSLVSEAMRQAASGRPRNQAAVLRALSRYGSMSRAQLGETVALSRTSVWSSVSSLLTEGIIVEESGDPVDRAPHGGRPVTLLRLAHPADAVIGIDFGRTHIRTALAELSGRILAEGRIAAQVDDMPVESMDSACTLVREMLNETGLDTSVVRQVVVGLPAPVNRSTGKITLGRILRGWSELDPSAEMERRIGMPVWVENNANLGALAESRSGAARGCEHVLYVKVSSGIGAGIIVNGHLYSGASGIAGEIGHVCVDEGGALCWCGSRGCLDTQASGRRMIELLQPTSDKPLSISSVIDLVLDGDPFARRIVADAGRSLGRVIADISSGLNPGAVVVGGELSRCGQMFLEAIDESLRRYLQPAIYDALVLLPAQMETRAEVAGAVIMALNRARQHPV